MFFTSLLRKTGRSAARAGRARVHEAKWPASVYAIGDVHGCLSLLQELEDKIVADARSQGGGEHLIVTLGDYVDRGPSSAGVLDHLLQAPPEGFRRETLAGNHEQLMLDFLAQPAPDHTWLQLGGDHTLRSYGLSTELLFGGKLSMRKRKELLHDFIPRRHSEFMNSMPVCLVLPRAIFVHAGIQQGVSLKDQSDDQMLWMRHPGTASESGKEGEPLVVHGHTPVQEPFVSEHRICIDTNAVFSGKLTAVRLTQAGDYRFISTG